jgi:hypothetical protein
METLPIFRKLWGRLDNGIEKGIYTLVIKDGKIVLTH